MRRIDDLVVHCTATKEGQDIPVRIIDQWHKNRGWSGIGYHYVIALDGTVEKGRPIIKQGAHVKGHNRHSIGIVYVGGLDSNLAPKDTRTQAQKEAIICLLQDLKQRFPDAKISGHRDFSPDINKNGIIEPFEWTKQCPCFNAKEEYNWI